MQNKYNNIFLVIKTALSDIVENDIEIDKNCIKDIFNIGIKHQILPILFNGLNKINSDFEGKKVFEKLIFKYIYFDQMQLYNIELIEKAFNENFVDYMLLKGASIKKIYPSSELRLMGDIDILINPAQYESAASIMSDFGFIEKKNTDHEWIWRNSNGIVVELHKRLIPSYNDDYYAYFKDSWEKAKPSGVGSSYIMPPEDEYIYYILHMYRHIIDAGVGIRMFLDSVVYRNAYPDMDREYLKKELEALDVWEFTQQVETLADCWFLTGKEIPSELLSLAENALTDGIYGTEERMIQQRMETLEKKYKNPLVRTFAYWSSRIFLSREEMECWYPRLEKMPWLLPVCWCMRLVEAVLKKPKTLLRQMKMTQRKGKKHGQYKTGRYSCTNE